jgi:vacuolar-type H+-ATPase subunit H
MYSPTKTETEFSPLDQIRQAEADVARQIASAHEVAGQTVALAKAQAKDLLNDARQFGKREGEKRYKEILFNAEEEAQVILVQARKRAARLRRRADQRMVLGVRYALDTIIGLEQPGENP